MNKKEYLKKTLLASSLSLALILTACSSDNSSHEEEEKTSFETKAERKLKDSKKDLKAKDSLESLVGEVIDVSDEMIVLNSKDRKVAGVILATNKVKSDPEFVFYKGDIVKLYFESSSKKDEGERIVELTYVDVLDEVDGDNAQTKINYYEYPQLSVARGSDSYTLSEKSSAMAHDIMNQFHWEKGKPEGYEGNFTIMNGVEVEAYFNSESGILYDEENDIHLELSEGLAQALQRALENKSK